ncbi:MAG: lipid-A-disaccharide synthase [Candidatus Omnitrophota bacterium]|jgi:lipid-A-disaccharide synthase
MKPKKILIVAGEPSGDLHASNLVKNLKSLNPDIKFFGIGGTLLKKCGVDIIFDISELALVGVVEVLKNIFTVGKAFKTVLAKADAERPDLAILVDYPGFNLRLARELKARSIPVVYYISPQVWAWGRDRVNIIKKCVKKIIVFFKFEEELYKTYGVDATFVGHPLLDTVKATMTKDEVLKMYDLSRGKPVVALLPGSRTLEVKSFLSVMISACAIINKSSGGAQFVIAKYEGLRRDLYEDAIKSSNLDIRIADNDTYNILTAADFAVVASGTATLETAIIGTPFVMIYRVNLLTYMLYKIVSTTKFIGIVNIIAGKEVVPELLQYEMTPENIAAEVLKLMSDEDKKTKMLEGLKRVRASLGTSGASLRAAEEILRLSL